MARGAWTLPQRHRSVHPAIGGGSDRVSQLSQNRPSGRVTERDLRVCMINDIGMMLYEVACCSGNSISLGQLSRQGAQNPAQLSKQVRPSRCGQAGAAKQVRPSRCGQAGAAKQVRPSRCGLVERQRSARPSCRCVMLSSMSDRWR
jgi:hypothetical protein